jgi:hypothetical protein
VFYSGWNLEDYTKEAKCTFAGEQRVVFKLEHCYEILKQLPMFEVDISTADKQVRLALNCMDLENDNDLDGEGDGGGEQDGGQNGSNSNPGSAVKRTQSPDIGKKEAKRLRFQNKVEDPTSQARLEVMHVLSDITEKRVVIMEQLQQQEREKIQITKERMMLQIFASNPTSEAAQSWYLLRQEEYLAQERKQIRARSSDRVHENHDEETNLNEN